jgi:hypothetical protein
MLAAADLVVAGVTIDADSATVRRVLGAPSRATRTGWQYPDLLVSFKRGKVSILSLTGPSHRTSCGLRVGDPAGRVRTLYRSCIEGASSLYTACWTTEDFDERAITISLHNGHVVRINVGRILEP